MANFESKVKNYICEVYEWGKQLQMGEHADEGLVDYYRSLLTPIVGTSSTAITPEPFYGDPKSDVMVIATNPQLLVKNQERMGLKNYFFYKGLTAAEFCDAVLKAHVIYPQQSRTGKNWQEFVKILRQRVGGLAGEGVKTNVVLVRTREWSPRIFSMAEKIESKCRGYFLPKFLQIVRPKIVVSIGRESLAWITQNNLLFKKANFSQIPLKLPNRYGRIDATAHGRHVVAETPWGHVAVIFFGHMANYEIVNWENLIGDCGKS